MDLVDVFVTTPCNYNEVLSVRKGERLYDAIEVDTGEEVRIVDPRTGAAHLVDPEYVVHSDITVWIFVAGEDEEDDEDDEEEEEEEEDIALKKKQDSPISPPQ